MSIQRHGVTRRYSDSAVYGDTVYLVEVPSNLDSGMVAQAENLLASVDKLLAQAGSNKSHLLMVTIYFADMADYDAMNLVWDAWVPEAGKFKISAGNGVDRGDHSRLNICTAVAAFACGDPAGDCSLDQYAAGRANPAQIFFRGGEHAAVITRTCF